MVKAFMFLAVALATSVTNASIIITDPSGSVELTPGGSTILTLIYDPTGDVNQDPLLAAYFKAVSSSPSFIIESVAINPLLFNAQPGLPAGEFGGEAISPLTGIFELGKVTLKGVLEGSGVFSLLTDTPYGVVRDSEFNPVVIGPSVNVGVAAVPEPNSLYVALGLMLCASSVFIKRTLYLQRMKYRLASVFH